MPALNVADTVASWLVKTFGSGRTVSSPWNLGTPLSTKADPTGGLIVSSYGLSQPVRTPRRFDKLADEGYNQSAPVFHAINLIAGGCAGIPWRLYQRKGLGVPKGPKRRGLEVTDHALLDLLQKPNPTQGGGKFFEAYVAYLYIAGNSYLWANRAQGGKGAPVELWTMRPDRMRILPDEKQFVGGYKYEVNGKGIEFDTASILHTKTFAPLDDWYGMSPLVVAARNIDIRNAGGDWNLALIQNSGRTPGFFVAKDRMGDTQFQRMREQLIDRYTGSRNVGLPGLLEDGVTWVANGLNPMDMDWSGLTLAQTRDIAITIGVPPEMLGDPEVKTYASYAEARASFYTETVCPLMDILRDELNRWLVPMYGSNLWLDYDTEDIEALAPLRAARWQQVQAATFLTINEKREATGYDAIPDGNVIILNATNATLDEVAAGDTGAGTSQGNRPGQPRALPAPKPGSRPNDGNGDSDGTQAPAPDDPGGAGTPDGGMGSAVDSGAKSHARYDPLDDILAGKVVRFHPKAQPPATGRRPSPYRRLSRSATG